MPVPSPSVPTPVLEVEVAREPRRGAPLAVLAAESDGSEPVLGPGADEFAEGWRTTVSPTGKAGEVRAVPTRDGRLQWLVGTGEGAVACWRCAGAALLRAVNDRAQAERHPGGKPPHSLQLRLPEDVEPAKVAAFVLGAVLGAYHFRVTTEPPPRIITTLRLITPRPGILAEPVRQATVLARSTALTRDLANMPSNVKDPAWLAAAATRSADGVRGLTVTTYDEKWLTERGFGGVLAVGGGSVRPPRLIELAWRPTAVKGPHLVLIGKGITFDTGGISIKPNEGMHLMRTDMAGGAAVIAAMRAIAELNLRVRVTGLVPAAENHVSGAAYRPGDVIRQYGGKTTEVVNTDAEGRLVLADALVYASRRLRADYLVDVATLTGAMKVALGLRTGGVFATNSALAQRIVAIGEQVGESWWPMPLGLDVAAEPDDDVVRGELGDVKQAPDGPGGITAAMFLREFTDGLPWIHLDIAGPARADSHYHEVVPGATGFAARTLVEFAAEIAGEHT